MTVNALANEAHNEGCQQLTEGERRVKGEVQVRAAGGPRLEVVVFCFCFVLLGVFLGGGGFFRKREEWNPDILHMG